MLQIFRNFAAAFFVFAKSEFEFTETICKRPKTFEMWTSSYQKQKQFYFEYTCERQSTIFVTLFKRNKKEYFDGKMRFFYKNCLDCGHLVL